MTDKSENKDLAASGSSTSPAPPPSRPSPGRAMPTPRRRLLDKAQPGSSRRRAGRQVELVRPDGDEVGRTSRRPTCSRTCWTASSPGRRRCRRAKATSRSTTILNAHRDHRAGQRDAPLRERPAARPPPPAAAAARRRRRLAGGRPRPARRTCWSRRRSPCSPRCSAIRCTVVMLSFQKYGLRELIAHKGAWVGIDNYSKIFHDAEFWHVVLRTSSSLSRAVSLTMVSARWSRCSSPVSRAVMRLLLTTGRVSSGRCRSWSRQQSSGGWSTPSSACSTR